MNPICFYHRADLDGVCSAAIVKKFVPDCELHGIDYGDEFPRDSVGSVESGQPWGPSVGRRPVYLVDFSLKPDEMRMLNDCCDLTWLDHHKSAIESCPDGIDGIRNPKFAGCELTWMWFAPEDPRSVPGLPQPAPFPEAVRLLGRYDVWDAKNPDWARIEAFQFGARAMPGIMDPANDIWFHWLEDDAHGKRQHCSISEVELRGRAILSYRDQEAKSLCADGAHEETIGLKAFVPVRADGGATRFYRLVCLNSLQRGSWQFDSVWDPEKHDAMCVYGRLKGGRWRVSLYSTKDEVDCGAICKALGGGGHKGAAGFLCDRLPWDGA